MPLTRAASLCALLLAAAPAAAAVRITQTKGEVGVLRKGADAVVPPIPMPFDLALGDTVETGGTAQAMIVYDDGAQVQLSPESQLTLSQEEDQTVVKLANGRLKSWVQGALKRHFSVRTPLAVAAVRGTEFDVAFEKEMLVEVYDGLIGVRDLLGNEVMVASGERLRVKPGQPLERPERLEGRVLADPKSEIRREVALGLSREAVQAAAAQEARLAEYQEGKTLIDAFGKRVRLEEYIIRPAADQFKLVSLNERGSRLDYFYYLGTFNKTLPADLSQALQDVNGKTGGSAPDFFLTAYETGRSNVTDAIKENASGGHLVNQPLTQDKTLYHAGTDSFETVPSGTSFWQTLFDNYSYKANGTEYFGWSPLSGSNIQAYDYDNFQTRVAGTAIAKGGSLCSTAAACLNVEGQLRPSTITSPNGSSALVQKVSLDYKQAIGGPTVYSETYTFYTIDDAGKVATATDFSGVLSGQSYLQTLLKYNYEQVINSSAFGGRSIDLVVEPKILIRSGLLQ